MCVCVCVCVCLLCKVCTSIKIFVAQKTKVDLIIRRSSEIFARFLQDESEKDLSLGRRKEKEKPLSLSLSLSLHIRTHVLLVFTSYDGILYTKLQAG